MPRQRESLSHSPGGVRAVREILRSALQIPPRTGTAVSGDDDPRQRRIRFKREYGVVGAVAEKNAQIEPGNVFLYRSGERTGRAVRIGKYYYLQG